MNEDRVQVRLRDLRESMAHMEAPDAVETAVMAAFREAAATRRQRRSQPVWRWAIAAGIAAMLLLGAWRVMHSEPTRVAVVDPPRPPAPKAVEALQQARPPVKPTRARKRAVVHARVQPAPPAVPPRPDAEQDATAFVPLPFAPPVAPSEDQQVVRVRLPRGAMRQFGVIVREDRLREPVQADFLLGQDGVARAVRLVSDTQ
jgi:hypothetical protein